MTVDTKKLRERLAGLPRAPWRWGHHERRESIMNLYSDKGDSEIGAGFPILWLERGSATVTLGAVTDFIADSRSLVEGLLDRIDALEAAYGYERMRKDEARADLDIAKADLAAMTAARDELATLCERGVYRDAPDVRQRISTLRGVGK